MPLTRSFKETVKARAERDPAFREALLTEGVDALLAGDMDAGKAILRDYINATVGFDRLAEETGTPAKSLMRMFGPGGNPNARNLFAVIHRLQRASGVSLASNPRDADGRCKIIMPAQPPKTLRIEARISPEMRAVLKRAADIQGRSVSGFVVSTALDAAHKVIADTEVIRLSREASLALAAALLDPPEPNEALRRSADCYRRLIASR